MTSPSDITLESKDFTVTFQWSVDRYTHGVTSKEGTLESCEDPGLETPVFTDAHQQGDLLFLSGMSGDRHWSMSVEPTPTGLAMDVACRVKSAVERIGSLYQSAGKITVVSEEIDSAPSCEIETLESGCLQIMPANVSSELPMTIHYRFRIGY